MMPSVQIDDFTNEGVVASSGSWPFQVNILQADAGDAEDSDRVDHSQRKARRAGPTPR